MRPMIYLAGPYSKDPINCTRRAIKVQSEIVELGGIVICPHANSHFADLELRKRGIVKEPDFWYDYDLVILDRCQAIVLMEGWEQSTGCRKEKTYAKNHGLRVYLWESELDRVELKKWLMEQESFVQNIRIWKSDDGLTNTAERCIVRPPIRPGEACGCCGYQPNTTAVPSRCPQCGHKFDNCL